MFQRGDELNAVKYLLNQFRVVVILGPRQCGKITLVRADHYSAFENPVDCHLSRFHLRLRTDKCFGCVGRKELGN